MTTQEILEAARAAKTVVALASSETHTHALWAMSDWLCHPENMEAILAANAEDMAAAKGHISDVMLDRLALTEERIGAMARGILEVAALPDPVGRVLNRVERPNGLVIEKTAVPMGVIAIIYESRPNVTSDAAALAIKSGNACILRCGKEAWRSANAIVKALRQGLVENGLPEAAVSLIEDTSHASANALMTAVGYVDLLIPRGGAGLIRACVENAKVPCIQTGTGICHIFVDDTADQDKALDIIENAKASRPACAMPRKYVWCIRPLRQSFCPSWLSVSARTARQRACIRWNYGWTSAPRPSSPASRQARRTLTPSFWITFWPSRSWTAWTRPLPTSLLTPPATAKPS